MLRSVQHEGAMNKIHLFTYQYVIIDTIKVCYSSAGYEGFLQLSALKRTDLVLIQRDAQSNTLLQVGTAIFERNRACNNIISH